METYINRRFKHIEVEEVDVERMQCLQYDSNFIDVS